MRRPPPVCKHPLPNSLRPLTRLEVAGRPAGCCRWHRLESRWVGPRLASTLTTSMLIGGCGPPDPDRTPPTCLGCPWMTALSAAPSPPRTAKSYRPSMFLTVTLPFYGPVTRTGTPADPVTYDYRRAALDGLHFPKLVDRLWQNVRRCAGYKVQYFAAVEPQRRLAPHLHAAIGGAIPRQLLRQVVAASYAQVWWPAFDRPV
jgi:hypothetical protein